MTQYVALLRGINVGGNNRVEMSRLREVFTSLGFKHVTTYINSGNIIFEALENDTRKMTERIEKSLTEAFGFSLRVVLRDAENIRML
ncbi:MAG: DUF1697 domain-containing protein, partial [Candidatus Gracilibacteria bacterium]|nr:DUF1697 domain-containing protein [Candidatus Gracilibacteria bacterium]